MGEAPKGTSLSARRFFKQTTPIRPRGEEEKNNGMNSRMPLLYNFHWFAVKLRMYVNFIWKLFLMATAPRFGYFSILKSGSFIDFDKSRTTTQFRIKSNLVPFFAANRARTVFRFEADASETNLPESSSLYYNIIIRKTFMVILPQCFPSSFISSFPTICFWLFLVHSI